MKVLLLLALLCLTGCCDFCPDRDVVHWGFGHWVYRDGRRELEWNKP